MLQKSYFLLMPIAYIECMPHLTFYCFRNLVRVTKSSQLQSVDPSQSNKVAYLGKLGKDFEFSHLGCKVDVLESSINTGDDDDPTEMKGLQDWISKLWSPNSKIIMIKSDLSPMFSFFPNVAWRLNMRLTWVIFKTCDC